MVDTNTNCTEVCSPKAQRTPSAVNCAQTHSASPACHSIRVSILSQLNGTGRQHILRRKSLSSSDPSDYDKLVGKFPFQSLTRSDPAPEKWNAGPGFLAKTFTPSLEMPTEFLQLFKSGSHVLARGNRANVELARRWSCSGWGSAEPAGRGTWEGKGLRWAKTL